MLFRSSINQGGKVTGWKDNLGILKLHVISINQAGTFGLGSTAAEVKSVQDNPREIKAYDSPYRDDIWYYGGTGSNASNVSINQGGKVTGWKDNLGILRLE